MEERTDFSVEEVCFNKVVENPVTFKVDKPGIQADRLLCLVKRLASFGSLQPFTARKIGDFPHFLSALASNNQFIIKLVKMWPGGTPHVVVGTLK